MRSFLTYLRDKVLGCQTKEERHTGYVACKGDLSAEFWSGTPSRRWCEGKVMLIDINVTVRHC